MSTPSIAVMPGAVTPGTPAAASSGASPESAGFSALVEQALAQQSAEGEQAGLPATAQDPAAVPGAAALTGFELMALQAALVRGGEVLFSAPPVAAEGGAGEVPLMPALVVPVITGAPASATSASAEAAAGPAAAPVLPATALAAGNEAAASPAAAVAAASAVAQAVPMTAIIRPAALAKASGAADAVTATTSAEASSVVPGMTVAPAAATSAVPAETPVQGVSTTAPASAVAAPTPQLTDVAAAPVEAARTAVAEQPAAAVAAEPSSASTPNASPSVAAPAASAAPAGSGAPGAPPAAVPTPAAQLIPHIAPLRQGADGSHTLVVRLSPEELGPVQVRVEVRQGVLSLELVGASEMAREALRAALPDLRRDLGSAGITTGSFDVRGDTAGRSGGGEFGRSGADTGTGTGGGGDRSGGSGTGGRGSAETVATPPAPVRTLTGDRALDLSL